MPRYHYRHRAPMPRCFCNRERLLHSMAQRGIDGLIVTSANNVFYLSGFAGIAHKSDEPRPYAVVLSRHDPDRAILIVADYYLGTVLTQPSWIEDVRTFRAVMMPLDQPAQDEDIDRFVPEYDRVNLRKRRAQHSAGFAAACQRAIADLALANGVLAFDESRLAAQLQIAHDQVRDAYDPRVSREPARRNASPSQHASFDPIHRSLPRIDTLALDRHHGSTPVVHARDSHRSARVQRRVQIGIQASEYER